MLKLEKLYKRLAWICPAGHIVPKKGASLSGGPQHAKGYHVHCPQCSRIVAEFVDPKETQ